MTDGTGATGVISVFDRPDLVRNIRRRVNGIWRGTGIAMVLLFFVLFLLTAVIVMEVASNDGHEKMIALLACVIAMALILGGAVRFADRRVQRRWYERGVPREITVTYAVTEEGLSASSEIGRGVTYWAAINDLFQARGHWIFLSAGTAICLPRDFFSSSAEERAFIRAALCHLTPAARQRSREAEAWTGKDRP